jgi:hypothetical protein
VRIRMALNERRWPILVDLAIVAGLFILLTFL